jgi:nicotinamide riboside transporter PnuC
MLSVMDIIYYLCLLLVSTRNPRVHPLTLIHLYIYIYIFNAGIGLIGTGTTVLYTRGKSVQLRI